MKRRRIFWGKSLAIVRISCYNKNNSTFQKRGMTLDILDMIAAAPRVFMSITIPDVIDIILLTLLLNAAAVCALEILAHGRRQRIQKKPL